MNTNENNPDQSQDELLNGKLNEDPKDQKSKASKTVKVPVAPRSSIMVRVAKNEKDIIEISPEAYSHSYQRLLNAEKILSERDSSDVTTVMDKWKPGKDGIINTIKSSEIPRVVTLTGTASAERRLMEMVEAYAHEPIFLPFGDLGKLKASAMHKINSYLSMIALRKKDIPDTDYKDILIANWPDIGSNEVELQTQIDQLDKLTSQAKDRYMMNNVIMPLFRDILIKDTGVKKLTGVNVLETAVMYSQWKQQSSQQILRGPLLQDVTNTLHASTWLESFSSLKSVLLSGFEQSSWIGYPMLLAAVEDDMVTKQQVYLTTPGKDSSISSTNQCYNITRKTALTSLHGNPLWVRDAFSANIPEKITKTDVAWTMMQLAKLKNVPIVSNVDMMFMSRYPNWSGLMIDDTQLEPSDEWIAFVNNLLEMEYIRNSTKLPNVDQSIISMFDEPNRSDLHATMGDRMYFVALCHKVSVQVLKDILVALNGSIEFMDNDFWETMGSLIDEKFDGANLALSGFSFMRSYDVAQPVFMPHEKSVSSSYYFMEKELTYKHPVSDYFKDILGKAGLMGSMDTKLISVRKFVTSDPGLFDIPKLNGQDDFVNVAAVKLSIENLDGIDENHSLYKVKDKLTPMTKNSNATTKGTAVIGQTDCIILTEYDLSKEKALLFDTIDVNLEDYDFSRIFDIHLKEKGFRILQPTGVFQIVSGDSFSYDPQILMFMPKDNQQFTDLIQKWEQTMNISPEENDDDPEAPAE